MGTVRLVALGALTCALAFSGNASSAVPNGPSPDLVISQVYGGGGNSGATYRQDFIEIFNRGSSCVSLAGRSLQYASAAGTGNLGANSGQLTELPDVNLAPGQYFLVRQAPGAGGTDDVPADHVDPTPIAMAAGAGKVALVEGTTSLGCNTADTCTEDQERRIIDLVGYGNTANYFEGTAPAPGLSNTTAAFRNGDGRQDSDVNSADFVAAPPSPRTSDPTNACLSEPAPFVAATNPSDDAMDVSSDSNVTITFSEPVTAAEDAFGFSCDGEAIAFTVSPSGSSTTYALTPTSPLPRGAECTVTVEGDQISDVDELDPPDTGADYVFSFTTQGLTGLRIHDIQGRQHLSPYRDLLVSSVPGIVTARRTNGFYYQDPQPDNDPRTSEGIFVFTGAAPPASVVVGAPVIVSGRVSEFRAGGSGGLGNLTLTEIVSPVITAGTETGTIEPTIVGAGGRVPPAVVIDNDTPDPTVDDPPLVSGDVESKSSPPGVTEPQDPTFDPAQDGIDFHESLEGMLVQINRAVAVSPTNAFGEIAVLADNGANAFLRTIRGGIIVRSLDFFLPHEYRRGDFNPERLILDDEVLRVNGEVAPLMSVRDSFTAPVLAVVDYSFGNFKYMMVNTPSVASGGLQPEVARAPRSNELSIASYNVENLDRVNDAARMDLIARQIIDNLRSPDLIALVEMQDDDGEGPGGLAGPAAGDPTFAALSTAVAAAGGPTYEWRQIDPVHNADGGAPNSNIRVGFFFRTDRGLSFVDRPGGTALTATEDDPAQPGAQLTFSPGRIDPTNPVWAASRKPLAGQFSWRGRKLFVVANHFNSKGGDQPLMGRFQEPMRPSEIQRRGTALPVEDPQLGQAGVVNAWVRRLLTAEPLANIVVLGDLNDFHFSGTGRVLEHGRNFSLELVNLYHFLPAADRYSYIFEGNAQDLDHVLVSPGLLLRGRPVLDPVHINAEFQDSVSDHDSLLVRFTLGGRDDDEDED